MFHLIISFSTFLVQDIVFQLHRFITALDKYHKDCNDVMQEADIFPIEVDLSLPSIRGMLMNENDDDDDDDDEDQEGNIRQVDENLFHDESVTSNSKSQYNAGDVDLLNIGP